ncbi:MAG: nucleotidyl transferase AbiEii/AbiGii toxin family protein [Bacteroidales bacterium]|nr:nucleotidyl transferase AbiEii/AbiGii toxin family protein [Bacteroidales bacterium]
MSRHLFDIFKISKSGFGRSALKDGQLFRKICNHRKVFTPIKGVDYNNLILQDLNFLPAGYLSEKYKSDYQDMRANMIYGESPEFDLIIEHLSKIVN